jgi:hypothetical protein
MTIRTIRLNASQLNGCSCGSIAKPYYIKNFP